jgi:hypothetical protein
MNRQQKKGRSFERLETRTLMAGNVTAAVVDGNLTITGDSSSNVIALHQIGDTGQWRITGGIKTSINGKLNSMVTESVTGDITIDLNSGNDRLTVQDGYIPGSLTVKMGDGNDAAALANLEIGNYLHFEGNNGNDVLGVRNVAVADPTFSYYSSIDMGDGNDTTRVNNLSDQNLSLTTGSGVDHLKMANSTFLGGPTEGLHIQSGGGGDVTRLINDTTGPLTVSVGGGKHNILKVNGCTADTANFEELGTGTISGKGNAFGAESTPGFTHLLGQFNI